MRVLITAGATRNPIDAVRYLSASSSGGTGVAVAGALVARGARVTLLASPEAALRAGLAGLEARVEEYGATRDLMARMEAWVRRHPGGHLVHAAAVGDYECEVSASKIPSGRAEWTLRLTPAPKIADHVRGWGLRGRYVTFKAAPPGTSEGDLLEIALAQRKRTGSDLVFANVLGRLGTGLLLVGEDVARFPERSAAIAALVAFVAG